MPRRAAAAKRSDKAVGPHRAFSMMRFPPFVLFVAVFGSIWAPILSHHHVRSPALDRNIVQASRLVPDRSILKEIGAIRTLHQWRGESSPGSVVEEAERILSGRFCLSDGTWVSFSWPLDPKDIEKEPLEWMLAFSAFAVPDRLIKAYEVTGGEKYLEKALEFILQWLEYEESSWLPVGLMWNDHAISERIYVLVDFWQAFSTSPLFREQDGENVLRLMRRSGEPLARPSHFTFATNHGVMQNLALMHMALCLPLLPGAGDYFRVARDRLIQQLKYYVSEEGAVLEHSAGYHLVGIQLLSVAWRYFQLAGEEVPMDLQLKHDKGVKFLVALIRPDGSLPLLGDTIGGEVITKLKLIDSVLGGGIISIEDLLRNRNNNDCSLLPFSGHAVWRRGLDAYGQEPSQLVATWSYFPGHGHKHADELSLLFWAAGQDWWTSSGYWAYGDFRRSQAVSWGGSNAPHVSGEKAGIDRFSRLKGMDCARTAAAVDIERTTEEGVRIRRQIIQTDSSLWLVLDYFEDEKGRPLETHWKAFPTVSMHIEGNEALFRLVGQDGQTALDVAFVGSEGMRIKPLIGSSDPFAGWVFLEGKPKAAPVMLVGQATCGGWTAALWALSQVSNGFVFRAVPEVHWASPEQWDILVDINGRKVSLMRRGQTISVDEVPALVLRKPSDLLTDRQSLNDSFKTTMGAYPKFRDLLPYRMRATYMVLSLLIFQMLAVALFKRYSFNHVKFLRLGACLGWLGIGSWLHFCYFAT